MKIEPIICKEIKTVHTSFLVDFKLEYNITFIIGDSGTGKSAVYSFFQEMSAEDKSIRCFNYLDKSKRYTSTIKQSKNKLFIIDNADILLNDDIRSYIARDAQNQYIIIGRNPTGLLLSADEVFELASEKKDGITVFTLVKAL